MSKKKVPTKIFFVGKGQKSDERYSPLVGVPNTNLDFYNKKTGKFTGRRKFDEHGNAKKDLDKVHPTHFGSNDHAHDYEGKNAEMNAP